MKESSTLTMESIERILETVKGEVSKDRGITEQRITAVLLLMQELMATYREAFGEQCKLEAKSNTSQTLRIFEFRFADDKLDPCLDEQAQNLAHLLKYGQDIPRWSYKNGWNIVMVYVPRISTAASVLNFCAGYAKGDKARLFFGFAVQLVGTAFNIAASFLIARLIVHYTDSAIEQAALAAVMIFGCIMIEEITICISEWTYNKISRHVLANIQKDLVDNVLAIQTSSMNTHGNAVFIRRMTDDAETLSTALTDNADLLIQIASYIGTLVAVFAVSWELFVYEACMLAILYFIQTWRARAMIDCNSRAKTAYEHYTSILSEMIQGHHDIRALHFEDRVSREIDSRVQVSNRRKEETLRQRWKYRLVSSTTLNVGDLAFMLLVVVLLWQNMLEPAMAVVLYNYHTRLGNKAIFTVMHFSDFSCQLRLAGDRIRSLIVSREFPKEHFGDKHLEQVAGKVEFKDVSFAYQAYGGSLKAGKTVLDDIMSMENGYDTKISEGGRDLSGGQRQRLAIARGLLCDARILLMDESTSALDNTTQREVLKAVRAMAGNRTVMMIAHRLSTIANADVIFFIHGGKVLASGTHEKLMETCGEYRELYQAEQVAAAY